MSTVMPEGELLRKAVKWISERRKEGETPLAQLVDEAAMRFNLGPLDSETLLKILKPEEES